MQQISILEKLAGVLSLAVLKTKDKDMIQSVNWQQSSQNIKWISELLSLFIFQDFDFPKLKINLQQIKGLEEIRAVGYPVWAVGVCPRRSRNEFAFGSINQPIDVAGVSVAAGDYVVADESGAVCVPHARADEVLALLARIEAQERALEEQVRDDAVKSWDEV